MKRLIEISDRTYRRLLKLYPPAHVAEYGEEMARLFRDLCRDAVRRRGAAGLLSAWAFILGDLAASLLVEGRNPMLMRKLAHGLLSSAAGAVLYLSVFKLTSLPLTEGQLLIGILCSLAVSLQLVILAVLVMPPRLAPSQGHLER